MAEANSGNNRSQTPPTPPPPQISEETPVRRKLKILVFHGYKQKGDVFKEQIGSFRKAVAKYAQLVFISAPHKVADDDGGDYRSWWFNIENNTFSGKCLGGPAIGFEASLDWIEKVVRDYGPFDGFMGFSQGACLVGLLAAMQQKGYLPYIFKFAIFASGFRSSSLVHKGFYYEQIILPTLHVCGEKDIIPKEMTESFINLFTKPVVAKHSGGHYVACYGAVKNAYQDFLSEQYHEILRKERK